MFAQIVYLWSVNFLCFSARQQCRYALAIEHDAMFPEHLAVGQYRHDPCGVDHRTGLCQLLAHECPACSGLSAGWRRAVLAGRVPGSV